MQGAHGVGERRSRVRRLISSALVAEARIGAPFVLRLPAFLRRRILPGEARRILGERRARRASDFLAVARRGIYANPGSPYRALLQAVGCEYGDLASMVEREGLETALRTLVRHGVYLTVDEFKGRQPVTRGTTRVVADPLRLRNPGAALHVPAGTGGSRGPGTPLLIDLAFIRECGINSGLALGARGGADWIKAHWLVPGASALARVLEFASFGTRPARWFSQVDPAQGGVHPRYRWSARAMRGASLLAGVPLPRLQYVSLEDPRPVAAWMARVLAEGGIPHLYTYPSAATRVCRAAREAGLGLRGGRFTVVGEPVTAAKLAAIREVGADAAPRYATIETGPLGDACGAPEAPDEVHAYDDLTALIQPAGSERPAGLPPDALLASTLRPAAPFVFLNVSLGDRATMRARACGCPMEALGWSIHLSAVRSFEKLTAGGMTFEDTNVVRILEEVLPARFGGDPSDYQLVEDEGPEGRPRLRLLVHPRLGPMDRTRIADAFLSALGADSASSRVMELQWRQLKLLAVEPEIPRATAAGKILHLHRAGAGPPT